MKCVITGGTVLQASCSVKFEALTRPDDYVIAIQVEDFTRGQNNTTPLSSVPLQVGDDHSLQFNESVTDFI